jgi:hypothetical protein
MNALMAMSPTRGLGRALAVLVLWLGSTTGCHSPVLPAREFFDNGSPDFTVSAFLYGLDTSQWYFVASCLHSDTGRVVSVDELDRLLALLPLPEARGRVVLERDGEDRAVASVPPREPDPESTERAPKIHRVGLTRINGLRHPVRIWFVDADRTFALTGVESVATP